MEITTVVFHSERSLSPEAINVANEIQKQYRVAAMSTRAVGGLETVDSNDPGVLSIRLSEIDEQIILISDSPDVLRRAALCGIHAIALLDEGEGLPEEVSSKVTVLLRDINALPGLL